MINKVRDLLLHADIKCNIVQCSSSSNVKTDNSNRKPQKTHATSNSMQHPPFNLPDRGFRLEPDRTMTSIRPTAPKDACSNTNISVRQVPARSVAETGAGIQPEVTIRVITCGYLLDCCLVNFSSSCLRMSRCAQTSLLSQRSRSCSEFALKWNTILLWSSLISDLGNPSTVIVVSLRRSGWKERKIRIYKLKGKTALGR